MRFIWPFIGISSSIVATYLEFSFIYHAICIKDFSGASESFVYLVILIVVLLIFMCILYNRPKIVNVLELMNRDFEQIYAMDTKYRDIFFGGQLKIWQLSIFWLVLDITTYLMFALSEVVRLIYFNIWVTQDENSVRPLMATFWLPADDPYRTPNFELFLFLQYLVMTVAMILFGTYLYLQIHFLIHSYVQVDIIELMFKNLFEGLNDKHVMLDPQHKLRIQTQNILQNRMRLIIQWHNSVLDIVKSACSIFGPVLTYQLLFSSIAICLAAYQVADQLDQGIFDILFVALITTTCIALWILCYIGSIIKTKAYCVCEACWNCGWEKTLLTRFIRTEIFMVILIAQKPLTISLSGVRSMDLETFSSIMSTTYTYFNMLRRMNED